VVTNSGLSSKIFSTLTLELFPTDTTLPALILSIKSGVVTNLVSLTPINLSTTFNLEKWGR
jgi:hypothetical protein